jgi:hypothetical protein
MAKNNEQQDLSKENDKVFTNEEGQLEAKHYKPVAKDDKNPLSEFDYARLRGDKFKKYFELVEGKNIVAHKSHSLPMRSGGLNRQKQYLFDKYRAIPIKETKNDFTEIVGIELVSTIPTNVGLRFPLEHAVTLNMQVANASRQYPCDIYLLSQDQTI